jgi:ssDNA-binding replication factor A large subunit
MSDSVEELFQKLLDSGFSEAELVKQVESKAKEFGGFMSEQGILFVIAKENGIYLQSSDINKQLYKEFEEEIDYDDFKIDISEIKEDMTNIVLLGKILQIYETREFIRKDGTPGIVGSFLLGDISQTIKVILWDDKVDITKNEFFRKNELIRIIGGYCRMGRDSNLEVHLGKKGRIILSPQNVSKNVEKKLNNLEYDQNQTDSPQNPISKIKDLIERYKYIKIIQGLIQIEEFKEVNTKTGEKTFLLKVILSDESKEIRVIIWGMNAIECLKVLSNGDFVEITNLAVKQNTYTDERELLFTKHSVLRIVYLHKD